MDNSQKIIISIEETEDGIGFEISTHFEPEIIFPGDEGFDAQSEQQQMFQVAAVKLFNRFNEAIQSDIDRKIEDLFGDPGNMPQC